MKLIFRLLLARFCITAALTIGGISDEESHSGVNSLAFGRYSNPKRDLMGGRQLLPLKRSYVIYNGTHLYRTFEGESVHELIAPTESKVSDDADNSSSIETTVKSSETNSVSQTISISTITPQEKDGKSEITNSDTLDSSTLAEKFNVTSTETRDFTSDRTSDDFNSRSTDAFTSLDTTKGTSGTSESFVLSTSATNSVINTSLSTIEPKETDKTSKFTNPTTSDTSTSAEESKVTRNQDITSSTSASVVTSDDTNSVTPYAFTSLKMTKGTAGTSQPPISHTSVNTSPDVSDSTTPKNIIFTGTDYSTQEITPSPTEDEISSAEIPSSSVPPYTITYPPYWYSTKLDTILSTTHQSKETTTSTHITTIEFPGTRTLKLAVSLTFLVIALLALVVLVIFVIRTRRRTIAYDELMLLP